MFLVLLNHLGTMEKIGLIRRFSFSRPGEQGVLASGERHRGSRASEHY
jgi:hypothetical protein